MEVKEARAIVDQHIENMLWFMLCQQFAVQIWYEPIEGGAWAEISVDYDRLKARLTLDHNSFANAEELLATLAHEILHIWHSPFELARKMNKDRNHAFEEAWMHQCERFVAERMPAMLILSGCKTWTAFAKMAGRRRKAYAKGIAG